MKIVFAQPCRTHIVSLLLLLLRPLVHAQASASGLSQPVHHEWQEKPEVEYSEALTCFTLFFSGDFEAAADLAGWDETKSGEESIIKLSQPHSMPVRVLLLLLLRHAQGTPIIDTCIRVKERGSLINSSYTHAL